MQGFGTGPFGVQPGSRHFGMHVHVHRFQRGRRWVGAAGRGYTRASDLGGTGRKKKVILSYRADLEWLLWSGLVWSEIALGG